MGLISGTDPIASWWFALILVVVVTAVVGVLLARIISVAAAIDREVAVVWTNGQRVANNTIHIAALHKTHNVVEGILARAGRIAQSATSIKSHAEDCPSCPKCIWHRD